MMYTFRTIPGGDKLTAQSFGQTVVGYFNKAQGTSTRPSWANPTAIVGNDRVFIVGAGTPDFPADPPLFPNPQAAVLKNAFEVSNNGHSIVYHNNTATNPAISGARYIDNTAVAWGRFSGGVLVSSFGLDLIRTIQQGVGLYRISLNYTDPYTAAQVPIAGGSSMVATIEGSESSYNCFFINTSPITFVGGGVNRNEGWIRVSQNAIVGGTLQCSAVNGDFFFVVFARP